MNSQTSWEQGKGLGWSIVVLQPRINPQSSQCNLQEVRSMQLVGRERRALRILNEVIALRGELTHNVWAMSSSIAGNEAVSHHQLASPVGGIVPDATTPIGGDITVNGAKGYSCLGGATMIVDPTTVSRCCIGRDRAVGECERPLIVDATAIMRGGIARDGAVGECERPFIIDSASIMRGSIAQDGAVGECEHPIIIDATAIMRGSIARDGAADEGECPIIIDSTAIMRGSIARDGTTDEGECPIIIDSAAIIHLGIYRPIVRDDAVDEGERSSLAVDVALLKRQVRNDGGRASW